MNRKITKEDTWRTDELKKHMRGYEEDIKRGEKMRRSEDERRHRSGASVGRRQRDPEREETRDKEKLKEREQKERSKQRELERYRDMDRRREDPREKGNERNERERDPRKDREKEKGVDIDRYRDGDRGSKDRRHDRVEKETRDKEKERERYKEKMSEREKERERDKRRAERERERRSERDMAGDVTRARLQDGEIETERDRRERNRSRDHMKESVHREAKEKNRERRERHGDHEQSGYREGREQREHRMEKEVGERRRKEGDHRGASETRNSERERRHRDHGGSEGRIRGERDRDRKRGREEPEKRHREESEQMKKGTSHKDKDNRQDRQDQMVVRSQSTWRSSQGDFNDPDIPVENEETEKPQGGDYEEVDYEEDFEDYEEDFEDADEDEHASGEEKEDDKEEDLSPQRREEIRAIQRAMDEENERVGSSQSRPRTGESLTPKTDTETQPPRGRQHKGVIDFVSAKRREVSKNVSNRQKKRSAELLRMIDLDFSITFSVLDLPPVNEYDMYIKSFGTTNTKQAYVQCNEDNTDREVQTEETDMSDKWTQHPAETSISCGGPDQSQDAVGDVTLRTNFDSRRLLSFLRSATQVMSVLLEEDRAERHALTRFKSQSDSLSFSDGCLQLHTRLPFLHGRQVSHLHFSDAQRQTLLSVHAPATKPSAVRLDSQSIICVWNIWEPSRPQKTLVYESEVCCCCFSPGKATLVFAGTSVGSVVLWDLREPSSSHYSLTIGESDWILRYPTFSTDAVLSVSGHLSTVRAVEPVTVPVSEGLRPELPLLVNQEESLGLSFLLASLDEKGVLNLWVVVELPKSSDAGSQTDLGLRPGGKVKLLHSSTLQTCESSRSSPHDVTHPGPLQALLLKFLPSDSSHYFIGTNMGVVNHGTRHGLKAPPKFYSPQVDGFRPVQITSLEFCPNGQPHFLVGCGDGSVRLHSIQSEQPLLEWSCSTAGEAVVSVQWALTRPAVFCVLDAASCLHLWDLVEDQQHPVLTERIDVDSVTAMAVFGDPATQNMYSGIALAKHSGRIEIHYFRKRFTVPSLADSEKLDSLTRDAL